MLSPVIVHKQILVVKCHLQKPIAQHQHSAKSENLNSGQKASFYNNPSITASVVMLHIPSADVTSYLRRSHDYQRRTCHFDFVNINQKE